MQSTRETVEVMVVSKKQEIIIGFPAKVLPPKIDPNKETPSSHYNGMTALTSLDEMKIGMIAREGEWGDPSPPLLGLH